MTHYWRIMKWLPERFHQLCRVVACGKKGMVLVEFQDGHRYVTSRWFVRRLDRSAKQPRRRSGAAPIPRQEEIQRENDRE